MVNTEDGCVPSSSQPEVTAASGAKLLYTAQLEYQDGQYTLIVQDQDRNRVHVSPVSRKVVDKLPFYLAMLKKTRK
ncbi:hypothetical protein [Streptomyces sp. NPDC055189]